MYGYFAKQNENIGEQKEFTTEGFKTGRSGSKPTFYAGSNSTRGMISTFLTFGTSLNPGSSHRNLLPS